MVEAAILGYGTVGSGVAEVIGKNSELIEKRCGGLHVKYILDLRDFPGDVYEDRIVHDADLIFNDPEVQVVCETMGGVGAAYAFSKRALLAGKSVCTSNKELVEKHGAELARLAAENQCNYFFEASVGGGIPLIRTIRRGLTAERIERICGILNGTTNYILHRMEKEGIGYEPALKAAQELGYAEADPTADIEGHDAGRKIAILASLVLGEKLDYESIPVEGIAKIGSKEIECAKALGGGIRLIAECRFTDGGVYARVCPQLVQADNPLFCARDVFNAVLIHSDMLDDSLYYGRGAGKLATASAVVADAVDAVMHLGRNVSSAWSDEKAVLRDPDDMRYQYMLRASGALEAELRSALTIDTVIPIEGSADKVLLSAEYSEGGFKAALGAVSNAPAYVRVMGGEYADR